MLRGAELRIIRGRMFTTAFTAQASIRATTTEDRPIMDTIHLIITNPHTTDGRITRGLLRCHTDGAGEERRGMAITVRTISRIRFILRRLSG